MALVIVLGSLLLPETNDPFLRPLLLSFSEQLVTTPQTEPQPVYLQAEAKQDDGPAQAADHKPEPPAEQPAEPPPAEVKAPEQPLAALAVGPELDDPFAAPLTLPRGLASAPAQLTSAGSSAAAVSALASLTEFRLQPQAQFDDAVERFIQYDIGRLTGEAGAKARRDFDQLGPEAIPALVHGLNRSASIHASCPVCVLTSKLQTALAQSNDRGMFSYAVANIGRDVPETAPHYQRLMNLVASLTESAETLLASLRSPDPQIRLHAMEQLLKQHATLRPHQRQEVAAALIDMLETDPATRLATHRVLVVLSQGAAGTPAEETLAIDAAETASQWRRHWRRASRLEELRRAEPHILKAELQSLDAAHCQAAAQAIAAQPGRFRDGQKLLLARTLIDLLSASDAENRAFAQRALAALAEENAARERSAEQWRAFWDEMEIDKLVGPRASSYLSMAQQLEARGQWRAAADRYRKILSDYPQTPAAAQARQRLAQLAAKG
jgi:hypothetical protein